MRGQVAKVNESAHSGWHSCCLYLDRGKRLAVLDLAGTVLLQTDGLDSNEAARVLYQIVSFASRLKTLALIRGDRKVSPSALRKQ